HRLGEVSVGMGRSSGNLPGSGDLALVLAQWHAPVLAGVHEAPRKLLSRLRAARGRTRGEPSRLILRPAEVYAQARTGYPALLHPGLVGHRQVGRRADARHRRAGTTITAGALGDLLLLRVRRRGRRTLLRCSPRRADAAPPDPPRVRDER